MSGNNPNVSGSSVWFICFFCKRAYQEENLLKKHKLESHRHLLKILKKRQKRIQRHEHENKKRKTSEKTNDKNKKKDKNGNSNNTEWSNEIENNSKKQQESNTTIQNKESDLNNNGKNSTSPDYGSNLIPDAPAAVIMKPQLAKKRIRKSSNALVVHDDGGMLQPRQPSAFFPEKKTKRGQSKRGEFRKSFACSFPGCTTRFSAMQTKRRHENLHINPTPFRCFCGVGFARREYMRKHAQREHPPGADQNDDDQV